MSAHREGRPFDRLMAALFPRPIETQRDRSRGALLRAISSLTANEQRVIHFRFGYGGDAMTLAAIGTMMGLTKQRIEQIEKKALRRLRHPTRWQKVAEQTQIGDARMGGR